MRANGSVYCMRMSTRRLPLDGVDQQLDPLTACLDKDVWGLGYVSLYDNCCVVARLARVVCIAVGCISMGMMKGILKDTQKSRPGLMAPNFLDKLAGLTIREFPIRAQCTIRIL